MSTLEITRPAPPGPSLGTHLPASYVRDLGRLMYFWGWPLVNMHNRHEMFAKVKDFAIGGALPVGPLNRISMLTDYIAPEQRSVATPNQDVIYGAAFLSLDKEPVVVQVPDFGKRFWVFQFLDQRTDTLGGVGAMYGTKPGFYVIVGPQWKGTVPNSISGVLHSPTNIAFIGPRVFMDDTPEDRQAIRSLVNQIMSYPLSEFDGTMKTKDWTKLPVMTDPGGAASAGGETKWVKPENYFSDLRAVLNEVPPLPGEEALYAVIAVDARHMRVLPNPMNRFLLNNQSKLEYGQDGSLTLYFASAKPNDAPEGNWLPTPGSMNYSLTFRFYGPRGGVADGSYYPPPLIKHNR